MSKENTVTVHTGIEEYRRKDGEWCITIMQVTDKRPFDIHKIRCDLEGAKDLHAALGNWISEQDSSAGGEASQ